MKSFSILLITLLSLSMSMLRPKYGEQVEEDTYYVGVNDYDITLFEGQYKVENGMTYNSYMILDEKVAVIDTIMKQNNLQELFLKNVENVKKLRKKIDYLIIQHMEPDIAGTIEKFMRSHRETVLVATKKAFKMINQFFGEEYKDRKIEVKEGDTLSLGKHTLAFVEAPMVHWPEVIVSYDAYTKTLFSADAFGKFGSNDYEEEWDSEARRYYIGIFGKLGNQVQILLKKVVTFDLKTICPTHGPILKSNLGNYITKYLTWSSYEPEEKGIVIAYSSIYRNTYAAVAYLESYIKQKDRDIKVTVHDLNKIDPSYAVADAFRYSHLVLASVTYYGDIFPSMQTFIDHLSRRNFQKKTVGFIENGSWALNANNVMKKLLEKSKDVQFLKKNVSIYSSMNKDTKRAIDEFGDELIANFRGKN